MSGIQTIRNGSFDLSFFYLDFLQVLVDYFIYIIYIDLERNRGSYLMVGYRKCILVYSAKHYQNYPDTVLKKNKYKN